MNVIVSEPAQIVLRNASEDERRRVWAWIDHLKRWETDAFARNHSKKLDSDDTYMLLTTSDVRIFFTLVGETITVLDVAKKDTIVRFGQTSGTTPP
jgi:hypothetical protein